MSVDAEVTALRARLTKALWACRAWLISGAIDPAQPAGVNGWWAKYPELFGSR